jgi:threonine/homoserine/homoserine lactone efflux protein
MFATAFVVALSGALMPGPLLAVTVNQAVRRGFWAGPRVVLGHGILELALIAVLATTLSGQIKSQLVPAAISLSGGIVLLALGSMAMKRVWQNIVSPTAASGEGTGRGPVFSGMLFSLSSPYWSIWWITIGMTYLLWSLKLGIPGVASFFSGHILADLAWYTLVAFVATTGKKVMNDSAYRVVLLVCGLALVGLGVYFITSGVRSFAG